MIELIPRTNINIIEETLSRIGICDKKNKILYPTSILYKDIDSKYYLCHFKEMFQFRKDKPYYNNMLPDDYVRLNSIALLLEDWDMIDIISLPEDEVFETIFVYVLPFENKREYTIKNKFNMRGLS